MVQDRHTRTMQIFVFLFWIGASRLAFANPCFPLELESQVKAVLSRINYPAQDPGVYRKSYRGGSSKAELMKALYESELVEASSYSFALGNKAVSNEVFKRLLGRSYENFLLNAVVDREFLCESFAGRAASRASIIAALRERFPSDVIAKPIFSESEGGKDFIVGIDKVADYLIKLNSPMGLFFQTHFLQERVSPTFVIDQGQQVLHEIRVHSLWGHVLRGMSAERWRNPVTSVSVRAAEDFIGAFLSKLPPGVTDRQGWAFDVVIRSERMQIIDINTNHGTPSAWSGFMVHPFFLKRLVDFLETEFHWEFNNWGSWRLRQGVGNLGESCGRLLNIFKRSGWQLRPDR